MRYVIVNIKLIGEEYPRYSKVKTQDYMVRYKETKQLRIELMNYLVQDLIKNKSTNICIDKMFLVIENILRYVENGKTNKYKIN